MIKCEAIKTFTLKRFDELENLIRKDKTKANEGKVYKGDIFDCNEDLAKYLMGENDKKETVVKILEVIPKKIEEVEDVIISEKPKKEEIEIEETKIEEAKQIGKPRNIKFKRNK